MRALVLSLATLLAAGVGPGSIPPAAPSAAPPTVVILVRHGEKGTQPAQDPPLSEAGAERARALVAVARDAGVTAIITTQYERTRKTAEPTATALRITPEVVAAGPAAVHGKAVADQVLKHAGGTVLVVGHSNTIPAIVGALGAPLPRELCDSEYDQVFVVVLGDTGPPRLIRSKYGASNAEDATCPAMQPR
jgi:broad specificity phosphatase PhoE